MVQLYGFNLNFLVIKFMFIFFDLCLGLLIHFSSNLLFLLLLRLLCIYIFI